MRAVQQEQGVCTCRATRAVCAVHAVRAVAPAMLTLRAVLMLCALWPSHACAVHAVSRAVHAAPSDLSARQHGCFLCLFPCFLCSPGKQSGDCDPGGQAAEGAVWLWLLQHER